MAASTSANQFGPLTPSVNRRLIAVTTGYKRGDTITIGSPNTIAGKTPWVISCVDQTGAATAFAFKAARTIAFGSGTTQVDASRDRIICDIAFIDTI